VDVLNDLAAKYCVKSIDKVVRIAAQYAITEGAHNRLAAIFKFPLSRAFRHLGSSLNLNREVSYVAGTKDKAVLDEIWHEKNTRCKTCGTFQCNNGRIIRMIARKHSRRVCRSLDSQI